MLTKKEPFQSILTFKYIPAGLFNRPISITFTWPELLFGHWLFQQQGWTPRTCALFARCSVPPVMTPAVVALTCMATEFMTYCFGCCCCCSLNKIGVCGFATACGIAGARVFGTLLIEFSGTRFSLWHSTDDSDAGSTSWVWLADIIRPSLKRCCNLYHVWRGKQKRTKNSQTYRAQRNQNRVQMRTRLCV